MMNDLIEAMKVALADTYAFAIKSQNFHWNVTGPNFSEYHAFFGGLYEDAADGVDLIAEGIRQLDAYAPASFKRFSELTTIEDEVKIPEALVMFSKIAVDNDKVLASLRKAYDLAEENKKYGISNFLQDRLTAHDKHAWMIKSFIKRI